ncbi:MAG: hypothetical protein IJ937_06400, partial [Treponema sp.]|nr:hypothetical protein [Treponema sp.]
GMEGNILTDDSEIYEYMGLELKVQNKSDVKIKGITIVFFLFDEDGEPTSNIKNNIVLNIGCDIPANGTLEDCISLDKYVYVFEDMLYSIDYLYISKIFYADGTTWNDPFGSKLLY